MPVTAVVVLDEMLTSPGPVIDTSSGTPFIAVPEPSLMVTHKLAPVVVPAARVTAAVFARVTEEAAPATHELPAASFATAEVATGDAPHVIVCVATTDGLPVVASICVQVSV